MAVPLAKLGEVAAGSSSKAELNVVLFIDPRFVKNLEGSVKKAWTDLEHCGREA